MPSLSTELLVIGADATGLGIAWDACLRGIKVVVVDQHDIAQGTSGHCHGLLHSGARYAMIDPAFAQTCASENAILRRIVPHAIEDTGGLYLSLQSDPQEYVEDWYHACKKIEINVEPLSNNQVLDREPSLTQEITQAFQVNAASLNSIELLNSLANSIRQAGGEILLNHRVEKLIIEENTVIAVELFSETDHTAIRFGAEIIINSAGPWVDRVATLAGIKIPITHSKGTMISMANRLTHTVIHRCRYPSDGDTIIPIGTTTVIGTTDVPVASADDRAIDNSEIDLLINQGEQLIPGLSNRRPLRAWSGIRPCYNGSHGHSQITCDDSHAHILMNHAELDGVSGFISIFGGNLSTYRLMAQHTVDMVVKELQIDVDCSTESIPLDTEQKEYFVLPKRTERLFERNTTSNDSVICECEIIRQSEIERFLQSVDHFELENLRRRTRLGTGPCQASFCALRASAIAYESHETQEVLNDLRSFIEGRWRGSASVAWGYSMRQMVLTHRLYLELFSLEQLMENNT